MILEILFLGKTKDSFLSAGIDEYFKRLQHYAEPKITLIKDKKKGNKSSGNIIEVEGDLLLKNIQQGSCVVALDFRGKQFSSEEFSKQISNWEIRNIRHVTFVIGGPDGLAEKVKNRADLLLSFSKMTFTHDMIRLFLLEQLYRAYTIKAGEKYHK